MTEGLPAVIPLGEASKLKLPFGFIYFPSATFESKLSQLLRQNKKSRSRGINLSFGGERGIRTPGSLDKEQRFSRPPHSTALPFLHFSISPNFLSQNS
jgi:hypothetical protein